MLERNSSAKASGVTYGVGFRVHGLRFAVKVRMQKRLESFVRCEEQLWLDCGGPSNSFSHPTPSKAAKPR